MCIVEHQHGGWAEYALSRTSSGALDRTGGVPHQLYGTFAEAKAAAFAFCVSKAAPILQSRGGAAGRRY